ncbi:MAG: PEGA domain-containing protein [Nanoarchaeota archaeon]|nr:PEGA domain-containing protein [Nanoarchaeota archaeon]
MKHKSIIFVYLLLLLINLMCLFTFAQDVGYIQIKCEPGAMVLLDDNFVGNTSSELKGLILQDVPAGPHQIKIVKEGFEPQSVKIDLKINEIYVYEVKEFSPQLDVKEQREADTDTIKQRIGSLLIETIPIDCIIEIPKLNINKEHYGDKTKKTWIYSNIPIGSYSVNFIALGKKIEYELKIEEGIQKHLLVNILSNKVEEIVPPPLTIGRTGPAGGYIFYDKGNYSDGWQYLEAAPASTEWKGQRMGKL